MTELLRTDGELTPWPPDVARAMLHAALAKVQEKLPAIEKTKTAVIKHKDGGGQHSYKYADLADVAAKVMPLLGVNGLAFTAFPIHRPDGKFGLDYHLTHESGASLDGWYEIRTDGLTIQDVGGRITYARRYILCSVTGVAADEDTDAREETPAAAQSPAKAVAARVKQPRAQTPVVQPSGTPQPAANPAAPPAPPREHLAGPQECWCGRNDHSIMGTHLHAVTEADTPGTITSAQLTALWTCLSEDYSFGRGDDDKKLARETIEKITGRQLAAGSSRNLSRDEAAKVINVLNVHRGDWDALQADINAATTAADSAKPS